MKQVLEQGGKIWRNQEGMALLITIMTLALLIAVTVEFSKTTWGRFLAANNFRVGIQLKAIAHSGLNIATAVLLADEEENTFDSLLDSWAKLGSEQFSELFPTGQMKIEVEDLSGRLPINSVIANGSGGQQGVDANTAMEIRGILYRMLLSGAFPVEGEMEAQGIVDAIVDWLDANDDESEYGAENGYYQSLERPYACRNKPLQNVDELILVKGMTPELLFGSGKSKGLAAYLTTYGKDGKINLNTAAPLVIRSLDPLLDENLVGRLIEYRNEKDNKEQLEQPAWYKSIDGWPGDIVLNQKIITTKSSYFNITVTGELDTLSRRLVTSVERQNNKKIVLLEKRVD